jgi:putative endonuclease
MNFAQTHFFGGILAPNPRHRAQASHLNDRNQKLVILSAVKNPRICLCFLLLLLPFAPKVALAITLFKTQMPETYYIYILASTFQKLYTGVTNNLPHRVHQHKTDKNPKAHTTRYKINKLVYYERFQYIQDAIARETQIKGWLRIKKLQLIAATNPTWRDLSLDWGQATEPFDEANLRPPETF